MKNLIVLILFLLLLPISKSYSNYSSMDLGFLPVYDFNDNHFGTEIRLDIDKSKIRVPVEWQFLFSESIRMRTWPMVYIDKKENKGSGTAFLSLYSSAVVKTSSSENSNAEFGFGGGYTCGGVNVAAWITTSVNKSSATVKDIFSLRLRAYVRPGRFYTITGFRIGTAIVDAGTFKTSTATVDFEAELGYYLFNELSLLGGVEMRTDNFGALIESDADVSGINKNFQVIGKLGIMYHY